MGVALAELVASLSYATDLGRGQPLEHTIRQTRIALRMADLLGVGADERVATYYGGLLVSVYCHADAREQAMWFGDDIELKAGVYAADMESLRALLLTLRRVGAGDAGLARARRILAFPARGWKDLGSFLRVHSTLQSEFAERIGLPREVTSALALSYARWDGKGEPAGVRGQDVPLAARVVALADLVEVYHRTAGVEAARGQLDPALVGLFPDNASELLAGLDEGSSWDEVIGAEPGLARTVAGDDLDASNAGRPCEPPRTRPPCDSPGLSEQRHACCQDLVAVVCDQDVVLDADAAEAAHGIGELPVDGISMPPAEVGVVQERRHEVDPRLDREDVAGQQGQVHA